MIGQCLQAILNRAVIAPSLRKYYDENLEHFIERAVVLTQGSDLEVSLAELKPPASAAPANISTLETAEREHILRALEESDWVIGGPNGAAARLGMKRTTLQSRMQKLGLSRQR